MTMMAGTHGAELMTKRCIPPELTPHAHAHLNVRHQRNCANEYDSGASRGVSRQASLVDDTVRVTVAVCVNEHIAD